MNIEMFSIMRHEIVLIVVAVILLIAEIMMKDSTKLKTIIPIAFTLFCIHTVIGFLPGTEGALFGGSYQSNPTVSLMKSILDLAVVIIFLQSWDWLKLEENREKVTEYFLLVIATLIGMNYMISSGDLMMMYLGLEIATIPMAGLVAYNKLSEKSAEGGIKLILSSALSSGIMLFGISFIYGLTGSTYYADIATSFTSSSLAILGFIFFVSGMAFKISLVPFHLWTADVYEGAPVNVTSYLSVASKGAAVFTFMIILYKVFANFIQVWEPLLYVLAITTMTVGNLFAIRQQNLKRFLAFSSISQAGFILLGIMGADANGFTSVIYFMLVYLFTNLAAFGVLSSLINKTGRENLDDLKGMYLTNPKISLTFVLAMFSLAGIPPAAGFFGKFFLFTAAASKGYYVLLIIAVMNATLSLYVYMRPIIAILMLSNDNPIQHFKSSWSIKLSLVVCVLGILIVGFYQEIYEFIHTLSYSL